MKHLIIYNLVVNKLKWNVCVENNIVIYYCILNNSNNNMKISCILQNKNIPFY